MITSFTKVINCIDRENSNAADAQISIMVKRESRVTTTVLPRVK